MKNFFLKIKNWFSRKWFALKLRWQGAKNSETGRKVHPIAKYVGSLLVIGLALLGTILYVRSQDEDNKDSDSPEIAQVYEPSIGSALPPDTPGQNGSVGEASVTEPTPTPVVAPASGVNLSGEFVAPNTGVDDDMPIKYSNDKFKFVATLPPKSNVIEQDDSITFTSQQASRYFTVSVSNQGNETLATIEAQLKNSTSVKTMQSTNFNGIAALQFTGMDKNNSGTVFIKDGKIYYLLGNQQYFSTFQTI